MKEQNYCAGLCTMALEIRMAKCEHSGGHTVFVIDLVQGQASWQVSKRFARCPPYRR